MKKKIPVTAMAVVITCFAMAQTKKEKLLPPQPPPPPAIAIKAVPPVPPKPAAPPQPPAPPEILQPKD